MTRSLSLRIGALTAGVLIAAACSNSGLPGVKPPIGDPELPDLVAAPPIDVHVRHENGRAMLHFTSVLVNVGTGNFVLRGTRTEAGDWAVEQEITHSTSGADLVPVDATMEWGGDGHNHWHVTRAATYHLERMDGEHSGDVGGQDLAGTKVGFCLYDTARQLNELGPDKGVFRHEECGKEDAEWFRMGLSPGWGDIYIWSLPGQSIDITDIPDGRYRLWAEADAPARFEELTRENNVSWVDLDISTLPGDLRAALVAGVGPAPGDQ